MSSVRRLLLLTALAAGIGGIAGAVFVVLDEPGQPSSDVTEFGPSRGSADEEVRDAGSQDANGRDANGRDAGAVGGEDPDEVTPTRVRSLTQRIDSEDPVERDELALELLRRGPAALAQARALRPASREGRELQSRLVAALQKMRALERGASYARLEEHLRRKLDLDTFATVVPDERLREERLEYWNQALSAVRARHAKGFASDGEVALAELELARVQSELGNVEPEAYAVLATKRLPACHTWLAALRKDRGTAPARIAALEEQLARLEP